MNSISNTKYKFKYIESFDTLRAFATLFVLLLHGSYGFLRGGWIGVDLFFVLSGYLITSIIHNEYIIFNNISFSKFYARRALRLFPPLIICIVIANVLWSSTKLFPGADQLTATTAAIFYFINFIPGNVAGNMAHLWSLSVEEHFYIFWPVFVLFVLFRLPFRSRIFFSIILICMSTIFRVYAYNHQIHLSNMLLIDPYRFTLCRIDNILTGALLSLILSKPKYTQIDKPKKDTLLIIIILFIFITILFKLDESNVYLNNGGFIFTNLLCVLTIFVAIKSSTNYLFLNKALNWIGKRSYGIYVYHFPIFLFLENFRQPHNTSNFLIISILRFILSIGLAALSFKYLEQPVLKLKKNFEPKTKIKELHL